MIADLKPYAEYKESGLPWLGQVPGHWEVRRLKQVSAGFWGGGTPQSGNSNYYCDPPNGHPWLMISDLTHQRRVRRTRKHLTEAGLASRNLKLLPAGTVLFSMYASLGTASILDVPAAVNQAIIGISPRRLILSSDFALYSLEQQKPSLLALASSSTQANLNAEKVRSLPIPLPPPDEQAAIVRFLDWANGRLERAIRAKRKVIALLNEQKQAIIHRAVTRGLDPNVPLKPSGVPWLGDIPQHWEERRLRSLTTESICNGVGESAQEFREEWPRYIRITDIADARSLRRGTRASLPPSLAVGAEVRQGDLLIAAVGATYGKAYVHSSDVEACFAGYLVRVRLSKHLDSGFAAYWTESQHYWHQLRANVIQSTIQNFSAARVKRLLAILPPPAEQAAIVRFLDADLERFNTTISRLEREIALLREYRTRLVADVVSGKLDVRAAAAALPEEAPPGDAPVLSVSEEEALAEDEAFE